jgi:hypothetical protein
MLRSLSLDYAPAMNWWIIPLAVLAWMPGARAQSDVLGTGDAYLRTCGAPISEAIAIGCRVYIRGMHDVVMLLVAFGDIKGVCPPKEGLSYVEIQNMTIAYLRSHPEFAMPGGGYETTGAYWLALLARYPCPAAPKPLPPADRRQ